GSSRGCAWARRRAAGEAGCRRRARGPRITPPAGFDTSAPARKDGRVPTLAQMVGQLLWCGFPGTTLPPRFAARIAAGEVGLAILFRGNIDAPERLAELCAALHAAAIQGGPEPPLLVGRDQGGGTVQRVRARATVWPPMLRLAARGDAALAEKVGRALGDELAVLGFDVDFAPVLDVHTNPANPVIGARAFGTTPDEVIRLAGAFARGLAAAGIVPCGKHFPGHGD